MKPPDNRGGPRKGRPDINHQREAYTEPVTSFHIPAHRLHPAEAHMKFVVNTVRREPTSWWLRVIREHQDSCRWCPLCVWTPGGSG